MIANVSSGPQGNAVAAAYQPSPVPFYQNNPLIEALPPILTTEGAVRAIMRRPPHCEKERELPSEIRYHLIQCFDQFFVPLPGHLDLEQKFSRILRHGYLARNPTNATPLQIHQRANALNSTGVLKFRSTATGFGFCGLSGAGKSTAIETILGLYPQVIDHSRYLDRSFILRQLVWLKLDTPHDGSIRALCLNFFQAVDQILGTSYYHMYVHSRVSADALLPKMALVAGQHRLGLLVIDELQHLSEAKSGGARQMLNFFVKLLNVIGLPVVMVGTYKAIPTLQSEFRQIRRSSGQGFLKWDRMPQDAIWTQFVKTMWRYQYTRTPVPLTPELSAVLYDETQGITDLVIKLYQLCQFVAIRHGKEAIDTDLIRTVSREHFALSRSVIRDIRNLKSTHPSWTRLTALGDVIPPDLDGAIQQILSEPLQASDVEAVEETPIPMKRPEKKEHIRRGKKQSSPVKITGLVACLVEDRDSGLSPYERLKTGGFIRPTTEFFPEEAIT